MPSTPDTPTLGPSFAGFEDYRSFAETVKNKSRYVWPVEINKFLDDILSSCDHREATLKKGQVFWRARLGCAISERTEDDGDLTIVLQEEAPFSPGEMKPIIKWDSEGRANPRGIPFLYMASTRDTALAEVRPWIDAQISIARLRLNTDAKIVDCSQHHAKGDIGKVILDRTLSRIDGVWLAIDQAFAKPVGKDDEARSYIPTQIIAELFKSKGYDGIGYKSVLQEDGFNLVMFDLNIVEVIQTQLCKAESLKYEFISTSPEHFPKP
jgi:hypothetical protein